MSAQKACQVERCQRRASFGRCGFPGFICRHHASIWRDSQARLDVLSRGRTWAREWAQREQGVAQ